MMYGSARLSRDRAGQTESALAHARSGDVQMIVGYIGEGNSLCAGHRGLCSSLCRSDQGGLRGAAALAERQASWAVAQNRGRAESSPKISRALSYANSRPGSASPARLLLACWGGATVTPHNSRGMVCG